MFAARPDPKRASDAHRAEYPARPLPLPTSRHDILVGGWEGERAGTDFAYEPRNLPTTSSER
jgi:hypothetical protein